ncbi:hypothetical protein BT93_L4550 [Corymbia citriodora subsp. variegata]|uniref:Uncharacterized protein n=1 Tax=Corymbia citriodora subsp. variegata TaxID=360336 RepID=A0A8T0CFX3_CORYI|nr:hypothetical protein BT93_L4550 [Corymbia citriodora subsp. variegata]
MLFFSLLTELLPILLFITAVLAQTDFYKILQLDKSCNDRDLKRAYRTLSKKYHPDKATGDEARFLEVADAYEALSDPATRKIYDQYGHEGLANHRRQGQGGGQHDPFDLFSRFFGGGGHSQPGVRRGPDMEVQLKIPLRDFYNGREVEFTLEKQQLCDHCTGSGSEDGKVETCTKCRGQGIVIQRHQLAPGMFQQIQTHCDQCGGQGKQIKNKCKVCEGSKVVRKSVTLVADVEPGMSRGQRIVFEGEAEEHPDHVTGNLVVRVEELEPVLADSGNVKEATDGTFFRRKGKDLYWREVISLREAWMGQWTRNITHLDGHVVQISRSRGQVVQPGQSETVVGEGMPIHYEGHVHEHSDQGSHGNLHIEYLVILPDQMDSSMESDFWGMWEKWRSKKGVDIHKDSGRPIQKRDIKQEL